MPKYSGVPAKAANTPQLLFRTREGIDALFVRSFSVMLSLQSPKSARRRSVAEPGAKRRKRRTTERKVSGVVYEHHQRTALLDTRETTRPMRMFSGFKSLRDKASAPSFPLGNADSPINDVEGMEVIERAQQLGSVEPASLLAEPTLVLQVMEQLSSVPTIFRQHYSPRRRSVPPPTLLPQIGRAHV